MARGLKKGCKRRRYRVCSGGSKAIGTSGTGLPSESNASLEEKTSGFFITASTMSGRVAANPLSSSMSLPRSRRICHAVSRYSAIGRSLSLSGLPAAGSAVMTAPSPALTAAHPSQPTTLVSGYCSKPSIPFCRPIPLALYPPYGESAPYQRPPLTADRAGPIRRAIASRAPARPEKHAAGEPVPAVVGDPHGIVVVVVGDRRPARGRKSPPGRSSSSCRRRRTASAPRSNPSAVARAARRRPPAVAPSDRRPRCSSRTRSRCSALISGPDRTAGSPGSP